MSALEIGWRLDVSVQTVRTWIARVNDTPSGTLTLDSLADRPRPGRPKIYDAAHIASLVRALLLSPPPSRAYWSLDTLQAHLFTHHAIGVRRVRLRDILRARNIIWDIPYVERGAEGTRG